MPAHFAKRRGNHCYGQEFDFQFFLSWLGNDGIRKIGLTPAAFGIGAFRVFCSLPGTGDAGLLAALLVSYCPPTAPAVLDRQNKFTNVFSTRKCYLARPPGLSAVQTRA